jgi:hypothetical protein
MIREGAIKKVMGLIHKMDKPKIKIKQPKQVSKFKQFVKSKWL